MLLTCGQPVHRISDMIARFCEMRIRRKSHNSLSLTNAIINTIFNATICMLLKIMYKSESVFLESHTKFQLKILRMESPAYLTGRSEWINDNLSEENEFCLFANVFLWQQSVDKRLHCLDWTFMLSSIFEFDTWKIINSQNVRKTNAIWTVCFAIDGGKITITVLCCQCTDTRQLAN